MTVAKLRKMSEQIEEIVAKVEDVGARLKDAKTSLQVAGIGACVIFAMVVLKRVGLI